MTTISPANFIGQSIEALPTPCLIVDRPTMQRNFARMQKFVTAHGKALRPHAKTHKSIQVAQEQLRHGAVGICAAKLSEAEGLIAGGIPHVLVTGPIATEEAQERLLRCLETGAQIMVTLDDVESARRLSAKLTKRGKVVEALIDLDPGFHRTGLPQSEALIAGQEINRLEGLRVRGIQCYAGDLQHITGWEERRAAVHSALRQAAGVFHQYREAGLTMDIFSGGGTGSVEFDVEIAEMTEVQPGSYVFMDAEYGAIEWGPQGEQAPCETSLSLLSTVITSHHAGFATIDAGLKALYRDGGYPAVTRPDGLNYDWYGDEYGKIISKDPTQRFKIGQKIHLTVSHLDPTINQFDYLYLCENGRVVEICAIDLRGCSQ